MSRMVIGVEAEEVARLRAVDVEGLEAVAGWGIDSRMYWAAVKCF